MNETTFSSLQIESLNKGIDVTLEGIHYYERYDQQMLIVFAVTTFLLWMSLIAASLFLGGQGVNYWDKAFWIYPAVVSPLIIQGWCLHIHRVCVHLLGPKHNMQYKIRINFCWCVDL